MKQVLARTLAALFAAVALLGQVPTGTISGTVTDESSALMPNVSVSITNKATGAKRTMVTTNEGLFSFPSLQAGAYEVRLEAAGFRQMVREAIVQTGAATTIDVQMQVGGTTEVVSVEAAASQIRYESHMIEGVVTRKEIESLPLNGRSFLQLAFLEPGVTVSPGSLAQYNAQFSVSVLGGASNMTNITVDGGNVRNHIEGGTGTNFSQEIVEEFQVASVNFDLSTSITGVGSVNIVTRSGGNDFHGAGYFYFRDHNTAAYPALRRNPIAPDPFFARRQSGFWLGGPIVRDRLFFFTNLEHNNQDGVVTVQPTTAAFAAFAGNYTTPYTAKLFSHRFDWRINTSHNFFVRYSHDGNRGFGPAGGAPLPSNWLRNTNWSDQGVAGLTSTLRSNLVNEFRFTTWYWQNRNLFPREEDCPGCIGLGLPQMTVVGDNVTFGNTANATQGRDLRRWVFSDIVSWQKGSHRVRFGGDFEPSYGTGFWGFADPAAGQVYGPQIINTQIPAALRPFYNLPATFSTNADLLRLPLAGFVMGIGDPSQPPPFQTDKARRNKRVHTFFQDTWRVKPRFTLNYGLAWSYESTLVNHDLPKPAFLAPLLGSDLSPTKRDYNNFSPSLGFAWTLDRANKTVLRAGAGIYYDTRVLWQRLRERATIGPVGNGRIQVSGSSVPNPIAGLPTIPGLPQQATLGAALQFATNPTSFTLGHLMQILPTVRSQVEAAVAAQASTSLAVRNIDIAKSGVDLIPINYPAIYSEHFNLGVQREISRDLVLTADLVFRQFLHQEITLDYNRYDRMRGSATGALPVIPECTAAQRSNPAALCSTGVITFFDPSERSNYKGLLVKLDKRFSNRYQFGVSYALATRNGINGINNLDNIFQNWGPNNGRHVLNISGIVELPWDFQVSFISAHSTRGPFRPSISGAVDLEGDGTNGTPLPGLDFKKRSLSREELTTLVNAFNRQYAGQVTPRNQLIPAIPALPASYRFGDNFHSQDIRVTKVFRFGERIKLNVFVESFNLLNVANLGGFTGDLLNPAFGQPNSRAGQVFGSGGPRAFQFGSRLSF
jgi:hypothetical protein